MDFTKTINDLDYIKTRVFGLITSRKHIIFDERLLNIHLDLLTNFPTPNRITPNELVYFNSRSGHIQLMNKDTDYRVISGVFTTPGEPALTIIEQNENMNYRVDNKCRYIWKSQSPKNVLKLFKDNIRRVDNRIFPLESDFDYVHRWLFTMHGDYKNCNNPEVLPILLPRAVSNNFFNSPTDKRIDYHNNKLLFRPTSELNYFIFKKDENTLTITNGLNNPVISTLKLSSSISDMDILIYKDRLVTIGKGKIKSIVDAHEYQLPTFRETRSMINRLKYEIYEVLNLTRPEIIGPNTFYYVFEFDGNSDDEYNHCIKQCKILNGFRISETGKLYDIYMNSIREANNCQLRYYQNHHTDEIYNVYY